MRTHPLYHHTVVLAVLGGLTLAVPAWAQDGDTAAATPPPRAYEAPNVIMDDGTVHVRAFDLPPSAYLSDEARAVQTLMVQDSEAPMFAALAAGKAGEMRARVKEFMAPRVEMLSKAYPVTLADSTHGGIPTVTITPTDLPKANAKKLLLNLPGSGFVMASAHGTGMLESIPLASLAKVTVVSVSYRQATEYKHPAALEDALAVYRDLLKTHKAKDIGVFGCSAGGLLTAQLMAALAKENLPMPAADGIFCAHGDARWTGDSTHFARPFGGLPGRMRARGYFEGVDLTDPLASPALHGDVLKHFPPTLLITATRAHEMSGAVNTHRELVKAGVEADLHMWDGLKHAFFYNVKLPEAREAFDVMRAFFTKHLHLKP